MPAKREPMIVRCTKLPPELARLVDQQAVLEDRTASAVIRRIVQGHYAVPR
jgi:hypothetical protein